MNTSTRRAPGASPATSPRVLPSSGGPQALLFALLLSLGSGTGIAEAQLAPRFTDATETTANRALHFALELGIWAAASVWGHQQREDGYRYALAAGLPLIAIATWTLFGTPGDPWQPGGRGSGGIEPLLAIPGWLRLTLELVTVALAAAALHDVGAPAGSALLGGAAALHYTISYQRIAWLLGLR